MRRIDFCTIVSPDEYNYKEQFEDAIDAANHFHKPMKINEDCPPPYYPFDTGKVYGLVLEVDKLQTEKTILRDVLKSIIEICDANMPENKDIVLLIVKSTAQVALKESAK